MSFVTTVILVFPGLEDEEARINEVNSFTYRGLPLDLRSIDSPSKEPFTVWYGGTKGVNGNIYVGSYNYFDVDAFLSHVSKVGWERPENIQIFIRSENEWHYNVYTNAGKDCIYKAVKQ